MGKDPIQSLIHLYEDGALNRRELINRLTRHTGTVAAAIAAVESGGLAEAQTPGRLAGVQAPENDPAILSQNLAIHGEGGAYLYINPAGGLCSKSEARCARSA